YPAVLSELAVAAELRDRRLVEVELEDVDLRRTLYAIWRRPGRLAPAAAEFLAEVLGRWRAARPRRVGCPRRPARPAPGGGGVPGARRGPPRPRGCPGRSPWSAPAGGVSRWLAVVRPGSGGAGRSPAIFRRRSHSAGNVDTYMKEL